MNHRSIYFSIFSIIILLIATGSATAQDPEPSTTVALGTNFTYQGRLSMDGSPANGFFDIEFYLFDALNGGIQVGGPISFNDLTLTDGYLTVQLDFGPSAFSGQVRYLEIRVRSGSDTGAFTILSPRQELTATPNAIYSLSAPWSGLKGVPASFADGIDNDTLYSNGNGLLLSGTIFSADTGYLQRRINSFCGSGYAIREVNADGSVSCEPVAGGAGDISAVNAGTGLSGGGLSGEVTLNVASTFMLPQTCANGQVTKWNSSTHLWECGDDSDTLYYNGTGLLLSSTTFSADTAYLQRRVGSICSTGSSIRVINSDGTVTCETDDDTTYTAGIGLTLSSGQFSLLSTYRLPQSCSNNQVPKWIGSTWTCAADDNTTSFWSLTGNSGTNPTTNYLGTSDNQTLVLRVNGQHALRLEPGASPNLIGGFSDNSVTSGVKGAAICGGGQAGNANLVTDSFGTISGGLNNQAGNDTGTVDDSRYDTVGGGMFNIASGQNATVGGGEFNYAINDFATVSGGWDNNANGASAAISGGWNNYAGGSYASVGGGSNNSANYLNATVGGGDYNSAGALSATVGGGSYNNASGSYSTIGGGGPSDTGNPNSTNNQTYDNYSTIGGGAYNRAGSDDGNTTNAIYATVGGGMFNRATNASATVDGGLGNKASGQEATVGGGGLNEASGVDSTISGGYSNFASNWDSTVGGGVWNTAYGMEATVGGGNANSAGGKDSTVGGGINNQATAQATTVGGGWVNIASGNAATVPGGANNEAAGAYSFASGADAHATHDGAFVWSSAVRTDSYDIQTFTVRAHNGARFYTASGTSTGVVLQAGGGSWSSLSDRDSKQNVSLMDPQVVLESLATLPISAWNYNSQDAEIRHIGPMAQDFYAAFGVGEDERYISSIDADGVALAAAQGLYILSQEQSARIETLETENADLKAQLSDIEARITAVEQGHPMGATQDSPAWLARAPWMLLAGLSVAVAFTWLRKAGTV